MTSTFSKAETNPGHPNPPYTVIYINCDPHNLSQKQLFKHKNRKKISVITF